jgi:phage-related protein
VRKRSLDIYISDQVRSEIRDWPTDVRKDLGAILTKLQIGFSVGFPDTKPIFTVAKGVFEIRLKDERGIFRVFYFIKTELGIVVFHSFQKKSQKTPKQEIDTGRKRMRIYLEELENEL